jgi:hypothetical protein
VSALSWFAAAVGIAVRSAEAASGVGAWSAAITAASVAVGGALFRRRTT